MPTIPAPLLCWIDRQFHDINGAPLVGGKIYSYEAGTSTPKALYTDHTLTTPATNPVILDAEGRATVYMAAGGYKFTVSDADDVALYTIDNVYDPAMTILENLGETFSEGSKGEATDYLIVASDTLVTIDGGTVYLPAATDRGFPVFIKNIGASPLVIAPDGTDTIEGLASYSIPAASSPTFPTVKLVSNKVSNWWILASHAL